MDDLPLPQPFLAFLLCIKESSRWMILVRIFLNLTETTIESEELNVVGKNHKSSLPENCRDDKMEWEEGDSFVPGATVPTADDQPWSSTAEIERATCESGGGKS